MNHDCSLRMRWNWGTPASLLAAVALAAGCAGGVVSQTATAPPAAASVTVQVCDSANSSCTGADSLSIAKVRDIAVTANWSNLAAGTHTQTVEVVLPNGDLYQELGTPFSVPDMPNGPQAVVMHIPVAGTWITQRELTGKWNVRLSADGQIFSAQSFELQP